MAAAPSITALEAISLFNWLANIVFLSVVLWVVGGRKVLTYSRRDPP